MFTEALESTSIGDNRVHEASLRRVEDAPDVLAGAVDAMYPNGDPSIQKIPAAMTPEVTTQPQIDRRSGAKLVDIVQQGEVQQGKGITDAQTAVEQAYLEAPPLADGKAVELKELRSKRQAERDKRDQEAA